MRQQEQFHEEKPFDQSDETIATDAHDEVSDTGGELSADQKIAAIEGLVRSAFDGEDPDVLVPLSGGITQSPHAEIGYKSLSWSDLGEHGTTTGGRTRVIATAEVSKIMPDVPVVTNSFNRYNADEPTMASITKAELVRRGVDSERIILEESSFSTITQLTELINLAIENDWENVALFVNEYYLPRITELIARLDQIVDDVSFQELLAKFKEQDRKIGLICAEPIMRIMDQRYAHYFDEVEASPGYAATVAAEAQGLSDLKAGKYRVVLKPEQSRTNT